MMKSKHWRRHILLFGFVVHIILPPLYIQKDSAHIFCFVVVWLVYASQSTLNYSPWRKELWYFIATIFPHALKWGAMDWCTLPGLRLPCKNHKYWMARCLSVGVEMKKTFSLLWSQKNRIRQEIKLEMKFVSLPK